MTKKIDDEMERLAGARLPELRAKYEEVLGESTRAPNKAYLLRRIREGLEAKAAAKRQPRTRRGDGDRGPAPRGRRSRDGLTQLTVDELQQRYQQAVGRPTSSADKGYLVWKIRMAQAGKVRVGPARERKHPPGTMQVVPLSLPRDVVAALDEAIGRTRFKDRSAFLRRAVHDLLKAQGFGQVAKRFEDA